MVGIHQFAYEWIERHTKRGPALLVGLVRADAAGEPVARSGYEHALANLLWVSRRSVIRAYRYQQVRIEQLKRRSTARAALRLSSLSEGPGPAAKAFADTRRDRVRVQPGLAEQGELRTVAAQEAIRQTQTQ